MELIRQCFVALQEGSFAGMFSNLCGPRNSVAKYPLQLDSSDIGSENTTTTYQSDDMTAFHGVCDGCGRSLSPPGFIVFVLGAPGTGKGTQCAFLAREFGFRHLSYGDLCRRLRKDPTSIVSRLDVKKGSNNPDVPDDLGAWLVWKEIGTEPGCRWLLDGFPKRVKQLAEFLKLMPTASLTLIFNCPEDVSIHRVAKRGKMAGQRARPEDLDPEISRHRIMDSHNNMVPIQRVLRERRIKFVEIHTNRPEDLIQEELRQIMSSASLAP